MKTLAALALMTGLMTGLALAATVNFDDLKTGAPPPGWTATKTGKGDPKWEVVAADSAPSKPNVLKQAGQAAFPVCIKDDTRLKDGFVEVKFKPLSGKQDQAGGVLWRCQDADNYYVARANALEDNVTIYHTIKGRRVSFKNVNEKVASGVWHTLRVDFQGNQFTVTFDGRKVIEAADDSFSEPGKVGVWTKADSVIVHLPIATSSMKLSPSVLPTRTAASVRVTSIAQRGWAQVPGRAGRSAQPDRAPGTRG